MKARWASLALLATGLGPCAPLRAQTQIDITADFDVSYVLGLSENTYSGVGTIEPLGDALLEATETFSGGTVASLDATFSIVAGDSFSATANGATASGSECTIVFTITGGTGSFTGATGSLTLNYTCEPGAPMVGSFKTAGTGTITVVCQQFVAPIALIFSAPRGFAGPLVQPIFFGNECPKSANFSTSFGPFWLIPPPDGTLPPNSEESLFLTVLPAGLVAGTYVELLTVTLDGQPFPVIVTLVIGEPELELSETGAQFSAASGAGPPPTESVDVLSQSGGSLDWTASASSVSGGNWLSVTPTSGTTGSSATVSVNSAGLQPGDYYGTVQFSAAKAANSPQTDVVVFHVLPSTSSAVSVAPTGLIFVAPGGGANPQSQTITVSNASNQAVSVTATAVAPENGLFSVNPASATASSSSPAQFTITANVTGPAAGAYHGFLELNFGGNSNEEIALLAVVPSSASVASRSSPLRDHAATCTPTKLLPVSTALAQSFNVAAAWPTPLQVTVVDDCGSPMGPGSVVASFSNGDPSLPLVALGGGMWSGTWQPSYAASAATVVITLSAESSTPALSGTAILSGTLQPNTTTPAIFAHGVVSTASFVPYAPLAPGAFASIFGANLAQSKALAGALPLPNKLAGAQVFAGGRPVPIQYVSGGQINILIPYDLAPNSTQQLIVQQGVALSTPASINIAPAQPAVFTQDQSGKGAGVITVVKPNGTQFNADPSHPASAGDALVIYCTGLGAVDQQIETGAASPGSPADKVSNAVTVTIGGRAASILFAGLTPTFAGLYQVNVTVPSGIKPGPSVPVVLTMGPLSSPPVTIAIQ